MAASGLPAAAPRRAPRTIVASVLLDVRAYAGGDEPRQHFVAEERQLFEIVHEREAEAEEARFGNANQLARNGVGVTDDGYPPCPAAQRLRYCTKCSGVCERE